MKKSPKLAQATKAPIIAILSSPTLEEMIKIPIEITTILAEAKPCMPSIKFMALIIPTEAKTVKIIPMIVNCKK